MKKFFIVSILVLTACATNQNKSLLLVSTTSTQDSGLLDILLPAFEAQSGYQVRLVATGSGQALKIGELGNADVILLHSPDAEKEFIANGFGIDRRLVMHNDFVIVGPPSDPASVQSQSELDSVFEVIYSSASTFVSRGDESGTHVKELAIWKNAGLDPHGQSWYLETGQGQGNTLSIASEKGGYALVDRGTFLAYKSNLNLEILFEGDPFLLNVYHVLSVNPDKWPDVNLEGAKAFEDFVTSPEGQRIIGEFGVKEYGQPLFFPDAVK
ncbi:MAG TPA: substrate-binding domain-containing protein [Anaerolineales bacterium]|nr:substrate-binding domain-containing protein [Anaerolineales bacterium]